MPSSVCIGVNSPADVVSWDPARCLRLPHLIALDQDSTEDLDDLGHGDDLARTMILVRILMILVILMVTVRILRMAVRILMIMVIVMVTVTTMKMTVRVVNLGIGALSNNLAVQRGLILTINI